MRMKDAVRGADSDGGEGEVNEVAPQNEGERLGSCGGRGRGGRGGT